MSNFKDISELRFWCQKVLPLVYDDSLSYYELLCKVVAKLNEVIQNVDGIPEYIKELINEGELKPLISTLLDELRSQIVLINEHESKTATANRITGQIVWLNGKLYRVTRPMLAGDQYVEGSNVEAITIETMIHEANGKIAQEIQDRYNSDNALSTLIDTKVSNEEIARVNSDNALNSKIDEEISNRSNADIDIYNRIEILDKASVKNIKERYYLFIGDSYGDENGEWATLVPEYLDLDSSHWDNLCVGGSGFVSNGELLFINQLINYSGDRNKITDIVICGGLNDSFSTNIGDSWWTTLTQNMINFSEYAKANYPNANISLGYIGNGVDFESSSLIGGRTYEARQLCKYFYNERGGVLGFNILHDIDLALCTSFSNMSEDGVHPSTVGSLALANAITQALINGNATIIYPLFDQSILTPYIGNIKFPYDVNNDITTIHLNNFYVAIGQGTSITNNLTLVTQLFSTYFNKSFSMNITLRLDGFDNKPYQYIDGRLVFIDKRVLLELTSADENGNFRSSYTATSQGYIRLNDMNIIIPTKYLA